MQFRRTSSDLESGDIPAKDEPMIKLLASSEADSYPNDNVPDIERCRSYALAFHATRVITFVGLFS